MSEPVCRGGCYIFHDQKAGRLSEDLLELSSPRIQYWDFPGGAVVRTLHCHAGGMGLSPGWGTKIPSVAPHPEKKSTIYNYYYFFLVPLI